jgi:hypothetical protein
VCFAGGSGDCLQSLDQEAAMRPIILFVVFLCSSCWLVGQGSQEKPAPEKTQVQTRSASSSLSDDDITAMREDIARMRAIVAQMESNLAFVDTTQSPLKHQFQLEIDMWNTVINEMERRLRPRK